MVMIDFAARGAGCRRGETGMKERWAYLRPKRSGNRNYAIHSGRPAQDGDGHVEIGTGRPAATHRAEGSLFVGEAAFKVVEGIFRKHYKKYDHYEIRNISRTTGMKIAANLREASERALACKGKEILSVLEYRLESSPQTVADFIRNKAAISKMLVGLADHIEHAYENDEWICVADAGGN